MKPQYEIFVCFQGGDIDETDGAHAQEEKKTDTEDNIDPVMKQYMEMIQQQKDKEKEVGHSS